MMSLIIRVAVSCCILVLLLSDPVFSQRGKKGGSKGRVRRADAKLTKKFDKDQNGWLNAEERAAAQKYHAENNPPRTRRGRGGDTGPIEPGPKLTPAEVKQYPDRSFYDDSVLRTLFLEFDNEDWEKQMAALYHTDVEMPAKLTVDGKTYDNVGIQFRGNSSFWSVPNGKKRSMSVTLDHVIDGQNVLGYRATTLLNAHADPTYLRSLLYSQIIKDYLPAPKVNYVRVVINGESWGIYINQQRYNKDFLKEAFDTRKGVRFKSSNRSRGGGLSYLGDSVDEYRQWYEIKSADKDENWKTLMEVCRVLKETPAEQLKEKLEPIFNIDGALRFLALDIVMMSGDGYWLHGSDYNLYVDKDGRLNVLHHDLNEAFNPQSRERRGERNVEVDPFFNTDDPNKAMRQKLLAVPEFRETYLRYVRQIATESLDWDKIGPKIEAYRQLIKADVQKDTRKLYPTEAFAKSFDGDGDTDPTASTIKGFIMKRRAYLLDHPEIKKLGQ